MKNLVYYFDEKYFIKEIKDFKKIILLLIEYGEIESSNHYKLALYAQILGFLENISKDVDIYHLVSDLYLDKNVMHKVYDILYSDKGKNQDTDCINYSYLKGKNLKYYDVENILNAIFFINLEIYSTESISEPLDKNISKLTKRK